MMYHYTASDIRVIDGDTIEATIDCGFNISFREKFRILDLDTPEIYGITNAEDKARGYAASARAKELLEGQTVLIHTKKDAKGKYGRYLADVYLKDGRNYAEIMKEEGFEKCIS